MKTILDDLKLALAKSDKERLDLQAQLKKAEEMANDLKELIAKHENGLAHQEQLPIFDVPHKETNCDRIVKIMREYRRPMKVSDIFHLARNRGRAFTTPNVVDSTLRKHPDIFTKFERGRWVLVDDNKP